MYVQGSLHKPCNSERLNGGKLTLKTLPALPTIGCKRHGAPAAGKGSIKVVGRNNERCGRLLRPANLSTSALPLIPPAEAPANQPARDRCQHRQLPPGQLRKRPDRK